MVLAKVGNILHIIFFWITVCVIGHRFYLVMLISTCISVIILVFFGYSYG